MAEPLSQSGARPALNCRFRDPAWQRPGKPDLPQDAPPLSDPPQPAID